MTKTRPLSPTDMPCILVKRLQNGIRALERARQDLIMSELDLVTINALINSNNAVLWKAKLKIKATDAEDAKKAEAELQRLGKLRLKKKKANLADVHRKSGYTSYVKRAPGSFEGGKK